MRDFSRVKRIVIKVGTRLLTDSSLIPPLVKQIAELKERGLRVILISSGAVGIGMKTLELMKRPAKLSSIQALAAIGQSKLMSIYERECAKYGFHAAGTSYRLYHGFQVGVCKFGVFMFGFIIDLNCNNIWIIFIGYPGIRIHMFKELNQVSFLVGPRFRVVKATILAIIILKSGGRSIGFRVTSLAKL